MLAVCLGLAADAVAQGSAESDRVALEALYDATDGPNWTDSSNWKTSAPLGEWYGVTIDADGRVTGLDLAGNALSGSIPVALGDLGSLQQLDLGSNELTGPLPSELGRLESLQRLSLSNNELTGPVPAWLGNLTRLWLLDLGWNELTGPVPGELGRLENLQLLFLGGNELTGPVPARLGSLTDLRHLILRRNKLTGPLPGELGDLENLAALRLDGNELTGPLPSELGRLANLSHLVLSRNDLTGPIPADLGSLVNLELLDFSYNWGLSGPLPSGLEESRLDELDFFMTRTCAPAAWKEWLATIEFRGPLCDTESDVIVDVAVVYTPAAKEAAGGTTAMEAAIDLMIAETNAAYAASGVRQRLALVGRSEAPYTETGDGLTDLFRLDDPKDGHLDDAHALRDRTGADLMHLIVAESSVSGIAFDAGVFGLTALDSGGLVFAHELGHNMGLRHDRFTEALDDRIAYSDPAYGYVNQRMFEAGAPPLSRWITIMSYSDQCGLADATCSWLPRFSNPRQRFGGDPLGIPFGEGSGVTGPADAVSVLNATGPAVAAWRDRPADAPNRPPMAVGTLPDRSLGPVGSVLEVRVSNAFTDPDGDALTHTASSSAPWVVETRSAERSVALTAVGEGAATIRVTATDPGGLSVSGFFAATVEGISDTVAHDSIESDRAALEALYDATGGTDWTDSSNWKTAAPLDEWHGVTTDADGRVTQLELGNNGLAGWIPSALGHLTRLLRLGLSWNELTGPIPREVGRLENLQGLWLGGNELTGPLPAWLGNLTHLSSLDLGRNELTGPLPGELGRLENLQRLSLGGNELTGSIPAWLGNLTHLSSIDLGWNELSGPLPGELGQLSNLGRLNLAGNNLTGSIPADVGNLVNLQRLDLSYNWGLSGPLPPGLEKSRLSDLDYFVTRTCAPAAWKEWLATIEFWGPLCEVESGVTIDVAIVYTPSAREAAGGTAAIEAAIDLMIAETNEAYAASGVRHRLTLVGRREVPYIESSGYLDLRRLEAPEDGHLDEAHAVRDRTGADLVHLIVAESNVRGIASLPGVFGLTVLDAGGLTFAHELGHNMGLRHDRFRVDLYEGRVSSHPAYGYVNQRMFDAAAPPSSRWTTIMAYEIQCRLAEGTCSWLPRFSNPRQRHDGDRLGIPFGEGSDVTGPADAAAVLNATGPAVAAWRDRPPDVPNRPPVAVGTLPDRSLGPVGDVLEVNVSNAFTDPDGDALIYVVSSSTPSVVTVHAAGASVTLVAQSVGRATVRVTATDPGGLSAEQSFAVTVTTTTVRAPFTDDPIRPGVTPVRAIHFAELRERVNAVREANGLGQFGWMDLVLRPGVTPVRLEHLTELRSALEAAYRAAGRPVPRWTDPVPVRGNTPIRAVHLMELRAAVVALE